MIQHTKKKKKEKEEKKSKNSAILKDGYNLYDLIFIFYVLPI